MEINLIPSRLYRLIYDKKIKLPAIFRTLLSIIFGMSFYVMIILAIISFSKQSSRTGLLFVGLTYLSMILYNWFRLNYQERLINNFEKINKFKQNNNHQGVLDEIDNIIQEIQDCSNEEYNTFNMVVLERLAKYISFFIYPILQSKNTAARNEIYNNLIPKLYRILKNKNNFYEIPKVLEEFDKKFLQINDIKKSLVMFYEKESSFFDKPINERMPTLRKLEEEREKGFIQKMYDFIIKNPQISAPIILIIIYLVLRYFGIDLTNNVIG